MTQGGAEGRRPYSRADKVQIGVLRDNQCSCSRREVKNTRRQPMFCNTIRQNPSGPVTSSSPGLAARTNLNRALFLNIFARWIEVASFWWRSVCLKDMAFNAATYAVLGLVRSWGVGS